MRVTVINADRLTTFAVAALGATALAGQVIRFYVWYAARRNGARV